MGKRDLYFLLRYGLHREDVEHPWVWARCKEFQSDPDGNLDLWFREGYKSTIATFGGTIQRIIRDPEATRVIFSATRPLAKTFLRQIKVELETNDVLKEWYPDVLWADPRKQSPKWSEDDGLVVKRKGNPKEATLEAWGLIDGQPVGPHWSDLHYEDVVTRELCGSPGMLQKVRDSFLMSLNLGQVKGGRRRAVGTRYHYADAYAMMIEKGIFKPRIHPATVDGKFDGEPVLWTREQLQKRIQDLGPYHAASQLFLDPSQESMQGFQEEWLRYWRADRLQGLNLYLLCDPASSKKAYADYTVFIVIGLGSDRNYYVVNWLRDRLSLTQKANVLFKWHQQYKPVGVGYEQYGMQADIEHFRDRMERDNYRFGITPLAGRMAKPDRIGRLVAPFSAGRFYLPQSCPYQQYDGTMVDITRQFKDVEYLAHPFEEHDDMLDCLSRIEDEDLAATFPQGEAIDPMQVGKAKDEEIDWQRHGRRGG